MKNRSSVEICAPVLIFAVLCVLSVPTLVMAIAWMTMGVCAVGYRAFEAFPTDGFTWRWLRGRRRAVVHFYHLACWPRYVRTELREFGLAVSRRVVRKNPFSPYHSASEQSARNEDRRM
jgi:hypothetical protein